MTSRTGVLDCGVLHTYKYNDDLFKKVTILPEGKNHGLLFIVDWSGSMGGVMHAHSQATADLVYVLQESWYSF